MEGGESLEAHKAEENSVKTDKQDIEEKIKFLKDPDVRGFCFGFTPEQEEAFIEGTSLRATILGCLDEVFGSSIPQTVDLGKKRAYGIASWMIDLQERLLNPEETRRAWRGEKKRTTTTAELFRRRGLGLGQGIDKIWKFLLNFDEKALSLMSKIPKEAQKIWKDFCELRYKDLRWAAIEPDLLVDLRDRDSQALLAFSIAGTLGKIREQAKSAGQPISFFEQKKDGKERVEWGEDDKVPVLFYKGDKGKVIDIKVLEEIPPNLKEEIEKVKEQMGDFEDWKPLGEIEEASLVAIDLDVNSPFVKGNAEKAFDKVEEMAKSGALNKLNNGALCPGAVFSSAEYEKDGQEKILQAVFEHACFDGGLAGDFMKGVKRSFGRYQKAVGLAEKEEYQGAEEYLREEKEHFRFYKEGRVAVYERKIEDQERGVPSSEMLAVAAQLAYHFLGEEKVVCANIPHGEKKRLYAPLSVAEGFLANPYPTVDFKKKGKLFKDIGPALAAFGSALGYKRGREERNQLSPVEQAMALVVYSGRIGKKVMDLGDRIPAISRILYASTLTPERGSCYPIHETPGGSPWSLPNIVVQHRKDKLIVVFSGAEKKFDNREFFEFCQEAGPLIYDFVEILNGWTAKYNESSQQGFSAEGNIPPDVQALRALRQLSGELQQVAD